MKMLSAVAIIATILSASVFAGDHTINAVGRTGFKYKDNDVKKIPTARNSSSFNVDFLRTNFAGSVSPSVKYFIAADLLGNSNSVDSVDNTSPVVNEAFITKTFSTGTSVSIGKKAIFVGGREYDYYLYDIYTESAFHFATPSNQAGLTVAHDIAGQTFTAQYFNGNKNNGQGTTVNAQSKFGYSVGWYGNIANGMIKPIVGYTVIPEAAGVTSRVNKGDDTFLGTGLQFNLPMNLIVEADYNLFTEKEAGTAKADLKTTSMVALVKYVGENFAPFAKFISDEKKTGSVKTDKTTAYDLGVEFKEAKEDMFRYHVVYSGSSVKTAMNTTEVKSSPSSILIGVKFDASVLK
jgi:hypothetical protein